MKTVVFPLPLFGFALPPVDFPLMLKGGPSLLFIPLFTSKGYAMAFATRANLPASMPLLELLTRDSISIFLSMGIPPGNTVEILFDPLELAIEETTAWSLDVFMAHLRGQ